MSAFFTWCCVRFRRIFVFSFCYWVAWRWKQNLTTKNNCCASQLLILLSSMSRYYKTVSSVCNHHFCAPTYHYCCTTSYESCHHPRCCGYCATRVVILLMQSMWIASIASLPPYAIIATTYHAWSQIAATCWLVCRYTANTVLGQPYFFALQIVRFPVIALVYEGGLHDLGEIHNIYDSCQSVKWIYLTADY